MAGARRLLFAGIAVVVLETLAGAIAVIALGPAKIAFYLLACAAATAAVGALTLRRIGPPGGGGRRGRSDGDGGGDGGAPPWWPKFERDFRRYARERERTPA